MLYKKRKQKKINRNLHGSACSRFCEAKENLVEVDNRLWGNLKDSFNCLSLGKSKFTINEILKLI